MRPSLSNIEAIVAPPRALPELRMHSTSFIKRVSAHKMLTAEDWNNEVWLAWHKALDMLVDVAKLTLRKPECHVLKFPDASDIFCEFSDAGTGGRAGGRRTSERHDA